MQYYNFKSDAKKVFVEKINSGAWQFVSEKAKTKHEILCDTTRWNSAHRLAEGGKTKLKKKQQQWKEQTFYVTQK
jgi:hypothetical protein